MAKTSYKNEKDFLRGFATKLKQTAVRPTIYGYKPYVDPETGRSPQTEFHSSEKKGRLFIGGNRSGKTVGGAAESVMWLTGQHPFLETPEPPVRGRCVSVDFTNGVEKIVKPEVAKWVPPSSLIDGSWEKSYNKELRTLTLANGSFMEFMSDDQDVDKFAGTSRHFIWFDEEPPQEIFNECMMRLADTGGSWWMTMTPVEGMTWVYDIIYEPGMLGTNENVKVVIVDSELNPYVSAAEREILYAFLDKDEQKARKEGKFVQLGGLIYPMFKKEIHVIPRFEPPKDWLDIASLDHGFTNPTAWYWTAVDPDGRMFVYDEHYRSGLVVADHAIEVHRHNKDHGRLPDYYVGDPSIRNTDPITGTSVLIEYAERDIEILLGNNDVRAGINRVATSLLGKHGSDGKRYPTLYITEDCVDLIREMHRYRWGTWANKKDDKKKNRKEEPHKKDDHACDSIRYMVASRPDLDDGSFVPDVPAIPRTGRGSRATTEDPDVGGFTDWDLEPQETKYQMMDDTLGSEY